MTEYKVSIDNGTYSTDMQVSAELVDILNNNGHNAEFIGRGPNVLQQYGLKSAASGTTGIFMVNGVCPMTMSDFANGIGSYYNYDHVIFAFEGWTITTDYGYSVLSCEGLETTPMTRAHDDSSSSGADAIGVTAKDYCDSHDTISYACGMTVQEVADMILTGKSGSSSSSSSTTTTNVKMGYSKSNPFNAYLTFKYTINDNDTEQQILVDFSREAHTTSLKYMNYDFAGSGSTINQSSIGFNNKLSVWLNDKDNINVFNLLEKLQIANNDLEGKNEYHIKKIMFETAFEKDTETEEETTTDDEGNETTTETTTNQVYDPETDQASYKMKLHNIGFYTGDVSNPTDYDSFGTSLNDVFEDLLDDTTYITRMEYKPHRNEDILSLKNLDGNYDSKCTFVEDPYSDTKYIENKDKKYYPITKISNVTYAPLKNMITNYIVTFNELADLFEETHYKSAANYINLDNILRYGEISATQNLSDTYSLQEARYIARNKYNTTNNEQTTFTVSCEGLPPCKIGDFASTEMFLPELTDIYNVASIEINCNRESRPQIQTSIGLGDIDKTIKVNEALQQQRKTLQSNVISKVSKYNDGTDSLWE